MSRTPTIPAPPLPPTPVSRVGGGPLKRFKGVGSGRRVREDGTCEFVLGVDEDGEAQEMTVGDYVEITQDVDLTGVDVIRVDATPYVQAIAHPAYGWVGSIRVDGILLVTRTVAPAGDSGSEWTDFQAPVRRFGGGVKTVSIRFRFSLL